MPRIILLTDFSEEYANQLLRGILRYSKGRDPWVLCKMPPSYRDVHGIEGVVEWALRWKADGIIAQFNNSDNVALFRQNGIAAVAQDYKRRFTAIPNITGAHREAGRMGADYFHRNGFRSFGFYGFSGVVWSEERCEGFRAEVERRGCAFSEYRNVSPDDLWFYESASLCEWLGALPKPCAIMACDDNRAHHIVEVCGQHGIRVPQDVAVLGVDNDEVVCTLSDPQLSSIEQGVEQGGYDAARLLERMIAEPDRERFDDVVVGVTRIVTRRSTDIYATSDNYISAALRYIHRNADSKLGVEDVVDQVPLSRRLLETRFRQETGTSVYAYIMKVRIEKLADALLEGDGNIADAAIRMGFGDYKNISRQFRVIKGCTPSQYRDSYLKHNL